MQTAPPLRDDTVMKALRGEVVTFRADPFLVGAEAALHHIPDALVLIQGGRLAAIGPYDEGAVPDGVTVTHHRNAVLVPGFIDLHVHYPQVEMIGAFGEHLLHWLDRYTFPTEARYADPAHAQAAAALFLRELLRAGTTTAAVYCTVHPESVEAFFAESERFDTRMIAGKVLMDRHAPEALLDTAEKGEAESEALIRRWHGRGRQLYAITPRFAPTSTPAQLAAAARLWRQFPGTYVQTHLAENRDECAWVAELFPQARSYLDVYHQAGLTGRRAIFGHAIHVDEPDLCCCHATGSALAHCPTSNLFLGSGLFRGFEAKRADRPVHVGLGTDVGGGTSLSQLQSLNEAYKVASLLGDRLTAAHGLFLATRGGAEALDLADTVGSLEPGLEADIVVLDWASTPLIASRMRTATSLMERLFVLMTLGDDRAVRATYVAGEPVYERDRVEQFCPVRE